MKIQLDYNTKVLTLDNSVNLGEFIEKIQGILPDWKEWKLDTHTTFNYTPSPVIIREYRNPWWEYVPTTIRYQTDGTSARLPIFSAEADLTAEASEPAKGVYQLDIQ